MNIVAEMTIQALSIGTSGELDRYCQALSAACEAEPPPFGSKSYGDIFRRVAADPYWMASSLVANAEREAEGSGRLWSLAACTRDVEISAYLKQHASDESRHARWYVAMLNLAFPDAVTDSLRLHLTALSPRYSAKMAPEPIDGSPFAHTVTLDDLIQMNIAEIRTAINQRLQRPVLIAHCPSSEHRKLTPLLDGLLKDEVRHVGYTARLIDRFALQVGVDYVIELMTARVRDFNEITYQEVDQNVFPLHCSSQQCQLQTSTTASCTVAAVN
jgi:hypothetical protein